MNPQNLEPENNIEDRKVSEPIDLKDIRGSIQVVSALPTYTPKTFYDSVVFYDSKLYIYDQSTQTWLPFNFNVGAVDSVNTQTGAVVLTQDHIGDGTTYKQYSQTEKTKLSGIETAADVTDAGNVGSSINGATAKTTPADADTTALIDSAASNALKQVTWANIKATLKTYFDTLYSGSVGEKRIGYDGTYYTYQHPFTLSWTTDDDGGTGTILPHSMYVGAGAHASAYTRVLGNTKAPFAFYQDNKLYITFAAQFFGTGDAGVNFCYFGLTVNTSGDVITGATSIYLDFNIASAFQLYFRTKNASGETSTHLPEAGSFDYENNNVYTIEYDYANGAARLYINGSTTASAEHLASAGAYLPTSIATAYLGFYIKNAKVTLPTISLDL